MYRRFSVGSLGVLLGTPSVVPSGRYRTNGIGYPRHLAYGIAQSAWPVCGMVDLSGTECTVVTLQQVVMVRRRLNDLCLREHLKKRLYGLLEISIRQGR